MKLVILSKAKYTKRWKGKDGKWNYEYADTKLYGGHKKGTKLTIDMGDGPENVTVIGGFGAGVNKNAQFVELRRDDRKGVGAPYRLHASKLKKVTVSK